MHGAPEHLGVAARLRSAVIPAFGAATICMLSVLAQLVSPTHDVVFHMAGPISALLVPAIFNLLLLTLLLALYLSIGGVASRTRATLWCCLLSFFPWITLNALRMLYDWMLPFRLNLSLLIASAIVFLLSILLWKPERATLYRRVQTAGAAVLTFPAFLGCILLVQMIWVGKNASHINDPSPLRHFAQTTPPHPRVLWIVFDELSYDQVVDSRYPDLALPTLDSFSAQATVFTHTIPAGIRTQAVLPSLITGLPDDDTRATADGRHLSLHLPASPASPAHWQTLDANQTVFADAISLGYHPAVAGWFIPYCRIFLGLLARCFWTGRNTTDSFFPNSTIRANLLYPELRLLRWSAGFFFKRYRRADQSLNSQFHLADYNRLYAAADSTLADPSLDFVLLHLPIPHPQGIYDRHHHVLTTGPSTYIDNLALVDAYLAHVRQTLQQQQTWDNTTVLIMGDHSWRTALIWKLQRGWSSEEQRASHGGQFDDRPFFALKLPNQQTPARINPPFHAANTRLLLDALLSHKIETPDQLLLWTQQHP
jgi:hypothetical protein